PARAVLVSSKLQRQHKTKTKTKPPAKPQSAQKDLSAREKLKRELELTRRLRGPDFFRPAPAGAPPATAPPATHVGPAVLVNITSASPPLPDDLLRTPSRRSARLHDSSPCPVRRTTMNPGSATAHSHRPQLPDPNDVLKTPVKRPDL
ncbi:hypothetical protein HK405_000742, partial [Cladochytrium tenue]